MKIVIQITFFLFILITTVICKVDCYASNKEKDLSGDIIRLKQDKYSSSFSTGKKDRFCKNNHPSGQFIIGGSLPLQEACPRLLIYAVWEPFPPVHSGVPYVDIQGSGIVQGIKSMLLFPVHYFW
jgi:hypothetical protein